MKYRFQIGIVFVYAMDRSDGYLTSMGAGRKPYPLGTMGGVKI